MQLGEIVSWRDKDKQIHRRASPTKSISILNRRIKIDNCKSNVIPPQTQSLTTSVRGLVFFYFGL